MIVEATGVTFGIIEEHMLESALEAPDQTFDSKELYPTKLEKAARSGYGLVVNHPFIDGNKRIGIYIMISFLEVNGVYLNFNDKEVETLALSIADGSFKYEEVIEFLIKKENE